MSQCQDISAPVTEAEPPKPSSAFRHRMLERPSARWAPQITQQLSTCPSCTLQAFSLRIRGDMDPRQTRAGIVGSRPMTGCHRTWITVVVYCNRRSACLVFFHRRRPKGGRRPMDETETSKRDQRGLSFRKRSCCNAIISHITSQLVLARFLTYCEPPQFPHSTQTKTMARTSIFRVSSALNAILLTCIILKHVALGVARSTMRNACLVVLMPFMFFHIAIIEG
ncbi:hypothetical protein BDP67DRAFT_264823 [Colletotrichum lupini]|nr:hypothetical protein BDP67DRAFT_264823 [Colletotrichum lupini]